MDAVYAISHSCLCPLGTSSEAVFNAVIKQEHALKEHVSGSITEMGSPEKYMVSKLNEDQIAFLESKFSSTRYSIFEQMCLFAIEQAASKAEIDLSGPDCSIILSSTKGNIEFLGTKYKERVNLHSAAASIAAYFKNSNPPVIISNACISGALALLTGKRMLEAGQYKYAIVAGCDHLSPFVLSGFQSFHALSSSPCRPFDEKRNGLNLGEAAACMVLATEKKGEETLAILAGGAVSNDANHLSGPSRTGAELALAITRSLKEANIRPEEIDMISAHGTATLYNDEMEAKAFYQSGVHHAPLHSLKSFIGHTLGAAGIIESLIACMGMKRQLLIPSLHFESPGVSVPVKVSRIPVTATLKHTLKTASGFGGCNAALVWQAL